MADEHAIVISRWRFQRLIRELARRGRDERESGAFLLARVGRGGRARRVVDVVYFDDLDPTALNGAISIPGEAFGPLFEHCEEHDLRVIADVHTHPGGGVGQSAVDAANPMIARSGHVGVILPHFAQRDTHPRHAGFHVYLGENNAWSSAFGDEAAALLRRTWW